MTRAVHGIWVRAWRGKPPGGLLLLVALVAAVFMSAPVIYVGIRAFSEAAERWTVLLDGRVPGLLWNTLLLAAVVALMAGTLGVSLAWLTTRTDLPARRAWRWLLVLPLAIPPYVGAMTYVIVFGPRGWAFDLLGSTPLNMYSFAGVAFTLSVFTYPYVYLVVGSAANRLGRSHEEAANSLGLSAAAVFRRVTLPLLRPAIGAGVVLVVLYVLSDFGAVAFLRYSTFTSAIYYQMGGFDMGAAAILSVILIVLTLLVLGAEAATRRRARFYQTGGVAHPPRPTALGRLRWVALAYVIAVFTVSVALPLAVLGYWTRVGLATGGGDRRFLEFATNTVQASGVAAAVAVVLAVPVVYLRSRHLAPPSVFIERLAYSGYALPGVIVALGVIFFSLRLAPVIYGTMLLVATAYVIRFLPQAMQSVSASLALVSPGIDEAARVAGLGPLGVVFRVIGRLIAPGVLAGAVLVFVGSAKELPATLLLRPAGFDTLAVRVWMEAGEGAYHLAAPPALMIVVLSLLPLKWILGRFQEAG